MQDKKGAEAPANCQLLGLGTINASVVQVVVVANKTKNGGVASTIQKSEGSNNNYHKQHCCAL